MDIDLIYWGLLRIIMFLVFAEVSFKIWPEAIENEGGSCHHLLSSDRGYFNELDVKQKQERRWLPIDKIHRTDLFPGAYKA